MIDCANVAATIHADMCDDNRNGYDQTYRWGERGSGYKTLTIGGRQYTYKVGDYDCSSSVILAWRLAIQYTPYAGKLDGATYTGNMRDVFTRSGLFYSSNQDAKRGDIYLNDTHHTAMCQDGGRDGVYGYDAMSQFSINENGKATGGKVGDQTGREAYVGAYYNYSRGWGNKLKYNGKADGEGTASAPTPSVSNSSEPAYTAKLDVDGEWGCKTTRRLQTVLGTFVDGYVDAQDDSLDQVNNGGLLAESWKHGVGGSPMVRAMQRVLGVDADGLFGPNTCRALQQRMGVTVAGTIGLPSDTVKALQKSLNDGKF